jgi:hypothetical protein
MEVKKRIRKTVEVVTDVLCDCCGKSCRVDASLGGDRQYEYMELTAFWGFGSPKKDLEKWTAKVCEKCVDKKLSKIIKFEVKDLQINSSITE